jgi:dTDP-4-amino-4,6-dideoxygalactose transaminase
MSCLPHIAEVPFLDLQAQNRSIEADLRAAVEEVVSGAQFILGPAVERFERHFADYVGVKHCVGLNNGTSSLHMALLACDVGAGDEVITTPHSWISTSWAISYVGARPVFVDIDPLTYTLNPKLVERAITPHTKAVLPVHLYGQSADLRPLLDLAAARGLMLIEDAAQAHGAKYESGRVGSFGRVGCFSFYPGKNLGAFGESGAIVTNDSDIAERIRRLRDHAQARRHEHVEIGYNTRMEGVQAAVLDVKLKYLDDWNAARCRHARRYHDLLKDTTELELPAETQPDSHVWHLFVALVDPGKREHLRRALAKSGVQTGVHYPTPIPFQPAYVHLGHKRGDFPVAEKVTASCLSLPMFPELTDEQVAWAVAALKESLASLSK